MAPKKSKASAVKANKSKAAPAEPNGTSTETAVADATTEANVTEEAPAEPTADPEPAKEEEPTAADAGEVKADPEEQTEEKPATKQSKKRKGDAAQHEPSKASRRSVRGSARAQPSHQQLLNYLISDAAADMCRPEDEIKDIGQHGKDMRTYSSTALSPFEELLCAVVLSRPISHRLGLRTIRTILNAPYNFTSPKAIKDTDSEKRHQALYDAKTQHKDKTAEQIGLIADVVAAEFAKDVSDTSLEKVRQQAKKDWDDERDLLQSHIKGLGKTGLDIFFRRIQWLWPEAYPFVDERTARGIEKLGLPKHPDELQKVLQENWSKLDSSALVDVEKEAKIRRAFVIICERATGADLEGKTDALLEAAVSS